MNDSNITKTPSQVDATFGKPKIGLAFWDPSGQPTMSWFTVRLAMGLLRLALQQAGLGFDEVIPLFADGFSVAITETPDPKAAARAVHRLLSAAGLLHPMCEVAYWDVDEGIWRTVHPDPWPLSFDRFFSDENIRAARESLKLTISHTEAVMDAWKRHLQNQPDPEEPKEDK